MILHSRRPKPAFLVSVLSTAILCVLAFLVPSGYGSYAPTQTCVQPPPGTIAWWPLDETSGTTAADRVGNHTGAYANAPVPADGQVRGALRFNGGNYVAVADSDLWAFGANNFTIELWANFDTPGGGSIGEPGDIFIGNDEGPFNRNKWFFALGGGFLNFHINGPTIGPKFFPLVPFSPVVGQWYHLAAVRSGSTYTIYVNGLPSGSATNTDLIPNPNAPLTIGQAENIGFMNGRLDEVTIYNRALTQEELQAINAAGSAGKCIDLDIRPDKGGDTGRVSVHINGTGFTQGATVKLVRAGDSDIVGAPVTVGIEGTTIDTTFDLTAKTQGLWDLVVTNPDNTTFTLPEGFTIEEGRAAQVWVDVVGLNLIRPGRTQSFHVFYGNTGNVDAVGVPLWIAGIPSDATLDLGVEVLPPVQIDDPTVDFSMVPTSINVGSEVVVPLLVSVIPTGSTGVLEFKVTITNAQPMRLRAWTNPPLFQSPPSEDVVECIIAIVAEATGEILDNGCTVAALTELFDLISDLGPDTLVNLSWAVLDVGFQCAVESACMLCTRRLTQACVVCVSGKIVEFGRDIYDAWQTGMACANTGIQIGEKFLDVSPVNSFDPNEKVGSQGVGSLQFLSGEESLRYSIFFENSETATAPAQEVVITDQLDTQNMDVITLSLGPIAFGDRQVIPPPGSSTFATDVDLRPEKNLIVRITASLNPNTGLLTWRLTSIDPTTGDLPADPLVGFLPPNVNPPEGDGSVLFTVMPKNGLPTGTQLRNQARIIFDTNVPIDTPEWFNTLDNTKPTSNVLALPPTQSSASFNVQWQGTDVGSGVRNYTIFVSENNGPFTTWLSNITATSGTFIGQSGKTYGFYSVAQDQTGNWEDPPNEADAITQVVAGADATLACGTLLSSRPINTPAQVDQITFSGLANERKTLTLTASGFPTFITATATVFSPTAVMVVTFNANSQQQLTLPESGTYVIQVRASDSVSTGAYSLGLECLLPTSPVDATLACGTLLSSRPINAAAQVDQITFSGQANERKTLTLTASGFPTFITATATVFSPTAVVVVTFNANSQQQLTLPESGTYVIQVRASDFVSTGSYSLGLECLLPPSPVHATLACGSLLSGQAIEAAAQVDQITFSGQANERKTLTLTGSGFPTFITATATVFSPTAVVVVTFNANSQQQLTLPESGTYVIQVRASDFVSTGSYSLGLECLLPTSPVDATLACGTLLSSRPINASAQVDQITFSGQANERKTLTLTGSGFPTFITATATVFSPTAVVVVTFNANSQQQLALPESGTYVIQVRASDLVSTGAYSLGFECLLPTSPVDATLVCGTPLSRSIDAAAQVDQLTFAGQANQQVTLTLTATGFPTFITATATVFSPTAVVVVTLNANGQQQLTLEENGTYVIQARASNLVSTGSYEVTLSACSPTAVTLLSFNASGHDDGVLVQWQTGYEADNLGFNIYREDGGKRVLVNQQLVAGSALVAGSGVVMQAGQSYSWWDKGMADCASRIADCQSMQYWLEDVDLNGQSTWHGPFFSKFVGGDGPTRSNSSMLGRTGNTQAGLTVPLERAATVESMKPEQIKLQSSFAGQTAVKLWVRREGFYKITASDLGRAGLDPKSDVRLLQLHADGRQIPINVITDKEGLLSAIEFYGRGLDAAYTDARVYWLVSGSQPGLRIEQMKGTGQAAAAQSFFYTVERRDRTIYFSALRNGEKENFFGPVIATSPVDQSLTLQHVDQSAAGAATIEVALQGVTTLPHKMWVYLNGAFAGEVSFKGQMEAISRLTVPQSVLTSGENDVRLVAQGGLSDISLVDYVRLSYWHTFAADNNSLCFTAAGNQEVTIGGFTSRAIRVLDVTDPDAPQELAVKIQPQKTGYSVTVASPAAGDRRLIATADEQSSKPAKIAANNPSSWRTTAHAADLVMIAGREFFSAMEPLKALRSKQGLKVELADIEDIFDEFSFGNKSPQAVKDFLVYATTNWKVKPRYVLLVGDASYDAKNYLGLGDWDLVPTKLIDTQLMETASDDWLTDFNGDGMADLAVGRLAARTPEEADAMVRKIIGYEGSEPLGSMLLVADTNNGFDFESAATELRGLIPANLRVEQINRGQVDEATAKSKLIDGIARGQKVVNYIGHGSVNVWNGSLLTNADARSLTNAERLPLFVMMTCLNGYFHHPALDSLAESLLKAERGGAVAVWTSTGMTSPMEQSVLNKRLYELLFTTENTRGQAMTLGDATLGAKAAVSDGDIRRTWVLLGDPTMRLR